MNQIGQSSADVRNPAPPDMHERIFNVSAGADFLLSNSMTGFALNFSLKEVYDCMTTSPRFVGEYSMIL